MDPDPLYIGLREATWQSTEYERGKADSERAARLRGAGLEATAFVLGMIAGAMLTGLVVLIWFASH
jgi:hypothetical protein